MPAETIHGDSNGLPIDVRISWGRGCNYVQVASMHDQGFEAMATIINEWLEAADMPQIDVAMLRQRLAGSKFEAAPLMFDGWHATFGERAAINKMIATLRRARDNAFGKDE